MAYVVFFLSHWLPVRPPLRPLLQVLLGTAGFTRAYSVLSLGILVRLVGSAGRAPFMPLRG